MRSQSLSISSAWYYNLFLYINKWFCNETTLKILQLKWFIVFPLVLVIIIVPQIIIWLPYSLLKREIDLIKWQRWWSKVRKFPFHFGNVCATYYNSNKTKSIVTKRKGTVEILSVIQSSIRRDKRKPFPIIHCQHLLKGRSFWIIRNDIC